MRCHDRAADGGDALKEVLGEGRDGSGEGLDEDDVGVGQLVLSVEALNTNGHFGG